LLISTSKTQELGHDMTVSKAETSSVMVVNVATHKAFGVFQQADQERVAPVVVGEYGTAQIGGHWYGFFGAFSYDGTHSNELKMDANGSLYPDIYRVDLDNGQMEMQTKSDINSVDWLIGPDGAVVARMLYNQKTGDWTVQAMQRHEAVIASGRQAIGFPSLDGLGRSPDTVLLESDGEAGSTYQEVPLAGGTIKTVDDVAGMSGALTDRLTGLWIGAHKEGDQGEWTLFAPALQAKLAGAYKAFDGYVPHLISFSDDFNHMIVKTEGGDDSGTYWIVDITKHSADPLGVEYPTVTPSFVGATSMIDYKAADGMALHGVLTLPPGRAAKNLPLVVMPHGGPSARDYVGFDYWAQAFAARGYAVFQPNFRGSDGYGKSYHDAGYGQWGRKMQSDISDGVAELVREGVADPKRECIVGWSYGGYAAQVGVTVQKGLYRCAVSMAGIADLGRMLRYVRDNFGAESSVTRDYTRFIGVTSDWTDAQANDISPIKLAGGADAPLLLIHGDQDTTVPIDQSQAMFAALKAAGKPVEFVTLPGADHWLLEEDARVAMLKASVAFVLKNNPPDPAPASAVVAK